MLRTLRGGHGSGRRWAALVGLAVTAGTVVGLAASGAESPTSYRSIAAACGPGRVIIQIHGTKSSGQFDPNVAIVQTLDPTNPDPSVFAPNNSNNEFGILLTNAGQCRLLTFSYDDVYLPRNGTARRGVYAWNQRTSPWNTMPDELADRLQALMDAVGVQDPTARFDLVAYSAGGIVPTYWAARPVTTDVARARVHSIIAIDAVVSGVDHWILDLACAIPAAAHHSYDAVGRPPCQFKVDSPYAHAIRTGDWWTKIPLATLRADGDLIVPYSTAGLPGRTVEDPPLRARGCSWPWEWLTEWPPIWGCMDKSHGSVLRDPDARAAIDRMVAR